MPTKNQEESPPPNLETQRHRAKSDAKPLGNEEAAGTRAAHYPQLTRVDMLNKKVRG